MTTISMRTGVEGPRHDPYHWDEITVTRPTGERTVLRQGLGSWCKHSLPDGLTRKVEGDIAAVVFFENCVGITVRAARKAYEFKEYVVPWRRHNARCPGRRFECVAGYPGESFTICSTCKDPIGYSFDRSAIE